MKKSILPEKNDLLTLLKKIRHGKITLERAKELQEDVKRNIKKLQKGHKTQGQKKKKKKKKLAKLNIFFNRRSEAIKFYEDCF